LTDDVIGHLHQHSCVSFLMTKSVSTQPATVGVPLTPLLYLQQALVHTFLSNLVMRSELL
jgi:hypothetical protein